MPTLVHASQTTRHRIAPRRRNNRGQALVLFVIFAAVMAIGVVLLFNSGQTVGKKVELTNATDAAAYSVAVQQAKAMNYAAYMNRARIANEVTVAQMVSIYSWQNMMHEHTRVGYDVTMALSVIPYVNIVARILNRIYQQLERVMATIRDTTHTILTAGGVVPNADGAVAVLSAMNSAYAASARMMLQGPAQAEAIHVARQVLERNDPDARIDGAGYLFLLDQMRRASGFADGELLKWYSRDTNDGAGMDRFRNTVMASRDRFSADRSQNVNLAFLRFGAWGGTDMVAYDRWAAMDTLAVRLRVPRWVRELLPSWLGSDVPLGYGGAQAIFRRSDGMPPFLDGIRAGQRGELGWYSDDHSRHYEPYGGARGNVARLAQRHPSVDRRYSTLRPTNRRPINNRESAYFQGYRGLQGYHDITDDRARTPEGEAAGPMFTVYAFTDRESARTSEDIDGIGGPEGGLLDLKSELPNDRVTAIATAQTYFNRPPDNPLFHRLVPRSWNAAPSRPTSDQQLEAGSLFSPYWQARLVETPFEYYALAGVRGLL